jgi:Tol biopolymer transport system component
VALSPGTRLGPYEVICAIGAGGMGEVYRAHDTKLNRDVAIKVLPHLFADDAERLARFTREAQTLASLNHPNIAHVHGLEESRPSGGTGPVIRALVMELVDGEDLSITIARGPVPFAEALPIAKQVADALEAAHEQGIVHRDLKPANIKLRADGTVKVLDFGLAKALGPDGRSASLADNSPTLTARATEVGMILGTAAYMAPEQARGKAVDRRADIWAFGIVLWELVTGRRAFEGEDVTEVLAKILERDLDLSQLPAATPPSLRKLIARCLLKDPKQRLRDIGEARVALDDAQRELAQGTMSGASAAAAAPVVTSPRWRTVLPWAIAAALLVALVVQVTRGPRETIAPRTVARLQIALPPNIELYSAVGSAISLSPDGTTLAFVGVRAGLRHVYLRRLDSFEATPVRGTETAVSCIFSPDGREMLVGASDSSLRRVRLVDGLVEMVSPATSEYLGGWLHNGRAVFTKEGRLWMTGATAGAAPTQLTQGQPGTPATESQPVPVPGENALLFVFGRPDSPDTARVEAFSLDTMTRTTVVERATNPQLTSSGHLLFLRDNGLLAAPFDRRALKITGEAVPVLRDVTIVRNRGVAAILTVSATGTLVYASSSDTLAEVVSVSRKGEEQTVFSTARPATNPRISRDGRRLMFEELGGGLWIADLERKTTARLTDGSEIAGFPIFSRDERSVVFRSPTGVFRMPLDAGAKPVRIPGTQASEFPSGFTPDGNELIYTKLTQSTAGDIYAIPLVGGTPRVVLSTPAYEGGAQFSPDGQWMVYVSNELGASEIFLQPYPSLDRRFQVSSSGGLHPLWNPKGGEIFYRSGDKLMSVRLTVGPAGPVLAPPVPLFSGRYAFGGGLTIPNFAVTADGERFIFVKDQSGARLNVVLNWFEELARAK